MHADGFLLHGGCGGGGIVFEHFRRNGLEIVKSKVFCGFFRYETPFAFHVREVVVQSAKHDERAPGLLDLALLVLVKPRKIAAQVLQGYPESMAKLVSRIPGTVAILKTGQRVHKRAVVLG